jgi:hypothetical protein
MCRLYLHLYLHFYLHVKKRMTFRSIFRFTFRLERNPQYRPNSLQMRTIGQRNSARQKGRIKKLPGQACRRAASPVRHTV